MVVNAGNGCAGPVLDALSKHLPFQLIKIHHAPDPTFPHGVPNPLLPENRHATAQAVKDHEAALGLAWDSDFDRCFFFDEQGTFIEGYYLVGLIAAALLAVQPGAAIIHDPRLTWNTIEMVQEAGGRPVMSKTGHAFIKARMRLENALYGGEMSGHHYFRRFAFCDSGMIPLAAGPGAHVPHRPTPVRPGPGKNHRTLAAAKSTAHCPTLMRPSSTSKRALCGPKLLPATAPTA